MPRARNCHETVFAARLPRNCPHCWGCLNEGKSRKKKNSLLGGRDNLGGILRDNLARVIASQRLPRDDGSSILAVRDLDVSRPSG